MKLIIGSHVSFKKDKQLLGSVQEALSYGSNAFMFYVGAPQNTRRCEIDKELTKKGFQLMKEFNIDPNNVIVHAPYIVNLANMEKQEFSIEFLKSEIKRVEKLGFTKLVLHPGNHLKLTREAGIENIIKGLNKIIEINSKVDIYLETMSGKGTELGINFYELNEIIKGVKYPNKLKVCLDTCHINDAGYNVKEFDKVLEEFDNIIGLEKLACIHLNDSKNERGLKKDRHENIGMGTIGFDALLKVVYHPLLENIPKILETPYVSNKPPYKFEIEMIKKKRFNPNLIKDITE